MIRRFALAVLLISCSPSSGTNAPSLGAIMSRVDVGSLIECGRMLPDYKSAALCLGAEAVTQGLRVALDRAHGLAERAELASGPSGADDMSDADRSALAAELDAAIDQLAVEIDATHSPG